MALLPILEFPDPRLRSVAKSVSVVDDRIKKLSEDMLETMYAAPGIGLAATQVNVQERLLVIDVSEDQSEPWVFINPEIEITTSATAGYWEGCLSVPGLRGYVERPTQLRVRYTDEEGSPRSLELQGFHATVIQHEFDHLDGKLYVDKITNSDLLVFEDQLTRFDEHWQQHPAVTTARDD